MLLNTKVTLYSILFFTDNFICPCLWVGTSLGSVLVIVLNLPPPGDQRLSQPVIVSPSGKCTKSTSPGRPATQSTCHSVTQW